MTAVKTETFHTKYNHDLIKEEESVNDIEDSIDFNELQTQLDAFSQNINQLKKEKEKLEKP